MQSRSVSPLARRLDWAFLALLALVAVVFVHRALSTFNYDWNWGRAWEFISTPNERFLGWSYFGFAILNTVKVCLLTAIFALLGGALVGVMRTSRVPFFSLMSASYVYGMRNIPPLVFIFIFYFFITPQILLLLPLEGLKGMLEGRELLQFLLVQPALLENMLAAILSLAVLEGAFVAEVVRGGFQAVPKGQGEAAEALGLSAWQKLRFVLFPQVLRVGVPQLGNILVSIVKNTAIVSLISVQELTFAAQEMANSSSLVFEIWLITAAIYWVLCVAIERAFKLLTQTRKSNA